MTQSKPTSLVYGLPQGPVLSPILFTIYRLPLGDIIKRHGTRFHMYADDWQLYTTFEGSDINQIALNMEILIDDICAWYSDNMPKLNDSKSEIILITSKFRPSVHLNHIKIDVSCISHSETVHNLGVIMEFNGSHINHNVQESFPIISTHPYYRWYLTDRSSKTAVVLTSHHDLIIAIVCSMVCQNTLKTAKCSEYRCRTVYQDQEVWPFKSSTSRSPLATYQN